MLSYHYLTCIPQAISLKLWYVTPFMSFRIDLRLVFEKIYQKLTCRDVIFLIILPVLYIYNLTCVRHTPLDNFMASLSSLVWFYTVVNLIEIYLYDPCQQMSFPQKRKAKSILE